MKPLRLLYAARTALLRVIPLVRDTRVPLSLKIATAVIGVLIISPIDLFGDIPVLGALDDGALLALLCMWFVRQASKHVERNVTPRPGAVLAVR
jgi:uncharacterized membrane protein YkvA (DUF1232 family)